MDTKGLDSVSELIKQVGICVADIRLDNTKLKEVSHDTEEELSILRACVKAILEFRLNGKDINWDAWVNVAKDVLGEGEKEP